MVLVLPQPITILDIVEVALKKEKKVRTERWYRFKSCTVVVVGGGGVLTRMIQFFVL